MCGLDELPPEKELSDAIDRLPNGKAMESDDISPEIMSQACAAVQTPRIYLSVPGGGHSASRHAGCHHHHPVQEQG